MSAIVWLWLGGALAIMLIHACGARDEGEPMILADLLTALIWPIYVALDLAGLLKGGDR